MCAKKTKDNKYKMTLTTPIKNPGTTKKISKGSKKSTLHVARHAINSISTLQCDHSIDSKENHNTPEYTPGLLKSQQALCKIAKLWRRYKREKPINDRDPITLEPLSHPIFKLVEPESGVVHGINLSSMAAFIKQGVSGPVNPMNLRELNRIEWGRLIRMCRQYNIDITSHPQQTTNDQEMCDVDENYIKRETDDNDQKYQQRGTDGEEKMLWEASKTRHRDIRFEFDAERFFMDAIEQTFDTMIESASYNCNLTCNLIQFSQACEDFTTEFMGFCCQLPSVTDDNYVSSFDSQYTSAQENVEENNRVMDDDDDDDDDDDGDVDVLNRMRGKLSSKHIDIATKVLTKFRNRIATITEINAPYYWPELLDKTHTVITNTYAILLSFCAGKRFTPGLNHFFGWHNYMDDDSSSNSFNGDDSSSSSSDDI